MALRPSLPRFDFSLNLDLIADVQAPESGPKSAKDKDAKRLARCGKCNNCKSQDCGSCYNCADKPKFGGPGIKKQACINRKCLLMVPRDEEGEKMARKRAKQRSGPTGGADSRAAKPAAVPTGFGTQSQNTGNSSPPSSPDADPREERDSLDSDRSSPLTLDEQSAYSFGPSNLIQCGVPSARLDPAEHTTGLTQAQTGLTPYFSAGVSSAADELPALFGDSVGFPQQRRDNTEFPRIFDDKLQPHRDQQRDWTWNNPMLLQEEFILMNDLHRRESAQPNNPVAAF